MDRQWWNVAILGTVFLLVFTAYSGIQNLATTLHPKHGGGAMSMGIIYAAVVLASPVGPRLVHLLGPRNCVLLSIVGYLQFVFANLSSSMVVLAASSAWLGFSGATLWVAQAVYIVRAAEWRGSSGSGGEALMSQSASLGEFSGLFWAVYGANQIIGNFMSFLIVHTLQPSLASWHAALQRLALTVSDSWGMRTAALAPPSMAATGTPKVSERAGSGTPRVAPWSLGWPSRLTTLGHSGAAVSQPGGPSRQPGNPSSLSSVLTPSGQVSSPSDPAALGRLLSKLQGIPSAAHVQLTPGAPASSTGSLGGSGIADTGSSRSVQGTPWLVAGTPFPGGRHDPKILPGTALALLGVYALVMAAALLVAWAFLRDLPERTSRLRRTTTSELESDGGRAQSGVLVVRPVGEEEGEEGYARVGIPVEDPAEAGQVAGYVVLSGAPGTGQEGGEGEDGRALLGGVPSVRQQGGEDLQHGYLGEETQEAQRQGQRQQDQQQGMQQGQREQRQQQEEEQRRQQEQQQQQQQQEQEQRLTQGQEHEQVQRPPQGQEHEQQHNGSPHEDEQQHPQDHQQQQQQQQEQQEEGRGKAGAPCITLTLSTKAVDFVDDALETALVLSEGDSEDGEAWGAHVGRTAEMPHVCGPTFLLGIIPLMIYAGIQAAYIAGDFTRYAVAESVGAAWIGGSMTVFGFFNVAACLGASRFSRSKDGAILTVTLGVLCQLAASTTLLLTSEYSWIQLMTVAALWGIGDATLQSQINTLLPFLFPSELDAAFTHWRIWSSAATSALFAVSPILSFPIKTYFVLISNIATLGCIFFVSVTTSHLKFL